MSENSMTEDFAICRVDDILSRAGQIARESEVEEHRKRAEETLELVRNSEENLRQKGASFVELCQTLHGGEPVATKGVVELIGQLTEPVDKTQEESDAKLPAGERLISFSQKVERYRCYVNDIAMPEPDRADIETLDDDVVSAWLENARGVIEARNWKINSYGELIAYCCREINHDSTKWERSVELNLSSPLISFFIERAKEESAEEGKNSEVVTTVATQDGSYGEPLTPASDTAPEGVDSAVAAGIPVTRPAEGTSAEDGNDASWSDVGLPLQEEEKRADVLFVIDASGSMDHCFDQLKTHIDSFLQPFRGAGYSSLRLGLLAYQAERRGDTCKLLTFFLCAENERPMSLLYHGGAEAGEKLFTRSDHGEVDVDGFCSRLDQIRCRYDENTPFALDCAADFPFGPVDTTRRIIVLFTDERIEDGVVDENLKNILGEIVAKLEQRHSYLHYFGPRSLEKGGATEYLQTSSRVIFTDIPAWQDNFGNGRDIWGTIRFDELMKNLGSSISSTVLEGGVEPEFKRAIHGQDKWQ